MPIAIPKFLKSAFAYAGMKKNIPDTAASTSAVASYQYGFPEKTMTPEEAGGVPPDGKDMNGILYELSSSIQYSQSGVYFPFNTEFATSIGGYNKGAIVSDASGDSYWVNTISGNLVFPANWVNFKFSDPAESIRGAPYLASRSEVVSGTGGAKMVSPINVSDAFGVGQVLVDFSGNRAMDVTYQNNNPRPICVYIGGQATVADTAYLVIRVGVTPSTLYDAAVSRSPVAPGGVAVNAIVPPGGYYSASQVSVTGLRWRELCNV